MTDRYLLAVLDVRSIGGGILLFAGGGAGSTLLLGPQDIDAVVLAEHLKDLLELVLEPEIRKRQTSPRLARTERK